MVIVTDKGTFKVISEYNIRAVLCDGVTEGGQTGSVEVSELPESPAQCIFVIEPSHDKKKCGRI